MSIHFGKYIYRLDSVSSTQNALQEMFTQGADAGTIVVAREQFLGRGRGGSAWDSQAGKGLWMSALIVPTGPEEMWTWVPLWTGIVARKAIIALLGDKNEYLHRRILIKWPNDILAGNFKLGGILAECAQNAHGRKAIILGLGINMLHCRQDFPPHLRHSAISLYEAFGKKYSPEALLEKVIMAFEELYPLLQPVHPDALKKLWLSAAWGLNMPLRVWSGNRVFEGTFTDLGPHGEICLRIDGNGLKLISSARKIQLLTNQ